MSVIKYLNPNYSEGEPKYITLPNLLASDPEVHIGDTAPSGDNYKLWIDTVDKSIKYNSSGTWVTLIGGGQLVNVDSTVTNITSIIESIDSGTPIIIEQDGTYYTVTSSEYDASNVTLEIIKDGNHYKYVINRNSGSVLENPVGVELVDNGDGNSYLANDGTYKKITSDKFILDINQLQEDTISSEYYNTLKDAINNNKIFILDARADNMFKNTITSVEADYNITNSGCITIILSQVRYDNSNKGNNPEINLNRYIISESDYSINYSYTAVDLSTYLTKTNTNAYTPTGDYNPATKKYVDDTINSKVASVYKVKGSVANYEALPSSNVEVGDVYNLLDTGANYVAISNNPIEWDKLSETVDLSNYLAKDNTTSYTPSADYNPATKKYVDDKIYEETLTINLADGEFLKTTFSSFNSENLPSLFLFKLQINIGDREVTDFISLPPNSSVNKQVNVSSNVVYNDAYTLNIYASHGTMKPYVTVSIVEHILTESQYAALGTSVNTDNVLYFITPD